jgi:hypothetical protein
MKMAGTHFLSPASIEALEKQVERELLRRAIAQKVITAEAEGVVRDLTPSDLNGVSGETWVQHCSAGQYNTVFSGQLLNPDKCVAIYGMADGFYTHLSGSAATSGGAAIPPGKTIKFGLGAGPAVIKDIWDISKIRTNPNRKQIFTHNPIYYDKGDKFTIQIRGERSAVDHVILIGKVCEAKGTTITPE